MSTASSIFRDQETLRLRYFDCRGLAETTRYMLAIGGLEYTDDRFPFTFGTPGDFTTISRPEFDKAQAAGEFDVGLGKVPLLEVGDQIISQSKAIERFVAKKAGLAGSNDLEAAQIDAVVEHVRDIKQAYQTPRKTEGDEAREEAMRVWFNETLPTTSQKLEKALPSCVADASAPLTHAHVSLYSLYNCFFDNLEGAQEAIADCPRLRSVCARVAEHPAVQKWEAVRPSTAF